VPNNEKLIRLKEQLNELIKSSFNDPNGDSSEIDRYLDMINQINKLLDLGKNKDGKENDK
jgi:hypothetical protein